MKLILRIIVLFCFSNKIYSAELFDGKFIIENSTIYRYIKNNVELSYDTNVVQIKHKITKNSISLSPLNKKANFKQLDPKFQLDVELYYIDKNSDEISVAILTSFGLVNLSKFDKYKNDIRVTKDDSRPKKSLSGRGAKIINEQTFKVFNQENQSYLELIKYYTSIFLIVYAIYTGINLSVYQKVSEIYSFIAKVILVSYLNLRFNNQGVAYAIIDSIFKLVATFISFIVKEIDSKGCDIAIYESGYDYALFDLIDCKLFELFEFIPNLFTSSIFQGFGIFSPVMIIIGLASLFNIFSILFEFIASYYVLIIMFYFCGYLAPLFVPTMLLSTSRSYFENWFSLICGCLFQMIILSIFLSFIFILIDMKSFAAENVIKIFLISVVAKILYNRLLSLSTDISGGITLGITNKIFNNNLIQSRAAEKSKNQENKISDKGLKINQKT